MTLHSPAFSRSIRERLRSECRASPALRKASRRQRGRRIPTARVKRVLWRLVLVAFPVTALLHMRATGEPAVVFTAVVSAWFLTVSVLGANIVRSEAVDLPGALLTLPFVSSDYRRLSRQRVLGLLWRPCSDALVLFVVLAAFEARGPRAWLAVLPLALLCGAAVWSASVWLARFRPPAAVGLLMNLLPLALFLGVFVRVIREWLFALLVQFAVPLTLFSPGGWLAATFFGGTGVMPPVWLVGLAPALLLASSGLFAVKGLVRRLEPEKVLLATWAAESSCGAFLEDDDEIEVPSAGPLERPPDFSTSWRETGVDCDGLGWVERLLVSWLDDRERLVLASITTEVPRWTRQTQRAVQFLAVGVAVAWLRCWAPSAFAVALGWVEGCALGIGLLIGLPVASGFDQMASATCTYGQKVARAALYPLRLPEFARLMLKAALVRGALMLPLAVAAAAALAVPWGVPAERLAAGGAKLVFMSVAFSPLLCVFAISGVSNDTEAGLRRAGCLVGLLFVGGVLVLLGLAAVALFASWAWGLASALGFAALAWGLSRAYIRLYERGGFDLVCAVRE